MGGFVFQKLAPGFIALATRELHGCERFYFWFDLVFLPDDEKALAWPLWMKVQSYTDGNVWQTIARAWINAEISSVAKVYEAVAGSKRLCSEGPVENHINYIAKFVEFLCYADPEAALTSLLKGEGNAGEKVNAFIGYELDDVGKSLSAVRNYAFGVKKWLDLNGVKVRVHSLFFFYY
jgi:hypothetical protein